MKPQAAGRGRSVLLATVAVLAAAAAAVLALPAVRGAPATGAAASAGAPASAASAPAAAPVPPPGQADPLFVTFTGDPVAGQRVVMGASGGGVGAACFQCHGLQGQGDGGGGFPRLAGQPAYYLYKQLADYASGARPHDVMTPIALQLSAQERRDAAAYYAAASPPRRDNAGAALPAGVDAEDVQRGGSIAAIGSPSRGVQSCVGCHGPAGSGMPPDTPYLAGLSPHYIELQLRLWSEGRRRNDALGVMADVARRLSPAERQAVAQYFGTLAPPSP